MTEVVDYQWAHFELLSVSPIFSHLLRHGATRPSSLELNRRRAVAWSRQVRPSGRAHSEISVNVFVNDALRKAVPRPLLVDIVNERRLRCRRHVINNDVWFRGIPLEKLREAMECRNLARVIDPDR